MLNLPNLFSLLRIPLAFVFLLDSPVYRAFAILLALLSDGIDGYLARRYNSVTRLGTLLDPFSDKFFVFFALIILLQEHRLNTWQAALLICRDFSVIIYGFYLAIRQRLYNYRYRAIYCGKIITVMQLLVLMALSYGVEIPLLLYNLFAILGLSALVELYLTDRRLKADLS